MIQYINSSQMQVWLYHSSRSCLSPTVGMLVFLMTFRPPAENEWKKLWIFAETYIRRTRSAHGQCKTFRRYFENACLFPSIRHSYRCSALNLLQKFPHKLLQTLQAHVQTDNWEAELWWDFPRPPWEPVSLRLVNHSSKMRSQATVTDAQFKCFELLECF